MGGASSVAVKAGDTLEGRYKIIKTVGEGGMGTVYLAEHMLIMRRVAIKILRPELATDAAVVERFMNEARAAGAIGHPHIVESTDMGFTRDEVPFIVFEYLEGTLLTDEIYRVRGMPPRRALRIAGQIASALSAAHAAGIIHRDLKSDNIFLTDKDDRSDHVKVLDFGISRFLEADTADDDSSNRALVMGTPEFMAPEQILSPERVDGRADIYALGVVLYEMLAARRPFDFDEPMRTDERRLSDTDKLLHKIVTEPVPPLHRPDLPPGLEELLRDKLLAKDPDERFQSMQDVQAVFEAFVAVSRRDSEPIPIASPVLASEGTAIPTAAPTPAPAAPAKRSGGIGWLVAAVLVAAAGAGVMFAQPEATARASSGNRVTQRAFEDAAAKLGTRLDSQAQASHMRAEGIGSLPMLRAAIETDAATLRDMVQDRDVLFKAQPDEVLEIFQIRNNTTTTLLRIPETAAALPPLGGGDTRVVTDGSAVAVIVGEPVANQKGVDQGVVALATPLDLGPVKQALAAHATSAALVGLEKPVVLVGTAPPVSAQSFPIKTSPQTKVGRLALAVAADSPQAATPAAAQPALKYAPFAAWGFAGLMLVMFAVSRARRS